MAILTSIVQSNDFIREIWGPRPIISAGGYDRDLAIEFADTKGDLIAFGRYFISNVSVSYTSTNVCDSLFPFVTSLIYPVA